jgi:predicted RNA-binding Zn-ribbon protein involved in translation (DUF1610 family)
VAGRECPSCGRTFDEQRDTCPSCLATLVDDADATVACPQCGQVSPARMHSCPSCLALLRPDPDAIDRELATALAAGRRLHRPAHRAPFAGGPGCTVTRLNANGGLVVCGLDGLIEANVAGRDHRAIAPLRCAVTAATGFRLDPYGPVPHALVATDDDGEPIGTYLRDGDVLHRSLEVRDGTSAPVARLRLRGLGGRAADLGLVETGGRLLATGTVRDVEIDEWVDDEWTLAPCVGDLPLPLDGFVALVLAAKVLLGRPAPVRAPDHRPDDSAADL